MFPRHNLTHFQYTGYTRQCVFEFSYYLYKPSPDFLKTFVTEWFPIKGRVSVFVCSYRVPSAHYNEIIMGAIASQITSLRIVYSIVYSDADQRKHQSSAPLAFVRGIHRSPVNSPHKWPVTRKMLPFDDVIMQLLFYIYMVKGVHTNRNKRLFHSHAILLLPHRLISQRILNGTTDLSQHLIR